MTVDLMNDWPLWCVGVTYKEVTAEIGDDKVTRWVTYEWTEDPFFVRATSQDKAVETIRKLADFAGYSVPKIVMEKVTA